MSPWHRQLSEKIGQDQEIAYQVRDSDVFVFIPDNEVVRVHEHIVLALKVLSLVANLELNLQIE